MHKKPKLIKVIGIPRRESNSGATEHKAVAPYTLNRDIQSVILEARLGEEVRKTVRIV